MGKSKKTKKAAGASLLTPEEQRSLDHLLGDLNQADPSRLADELPGPRFAEALVEKLAIEDPNTPRVLVALRSSFHDKSVQKAIKKAAFKLRQKGILLPEEKESAAPVPKAGQAGASGNLAYLGPIDGTGSRAVFISVPQMPAGVDVALGVVNDEQGIMEFDFTRHSKKRMKEIKEILFSKLPHMVETTLSHAADVLERSYRAKGPGLHESARAYLLFRPWLLEHSSRIERPAVYELLAPDTIRFDLPSELQVQRLLAHELMGSWMTDLKSLRSLIEEIRKAEQSRIFISEAQRLEHIHRIKHEGIAKVFSEARRESIKYRLEEMAYVFLKCAEESLARVCLAAASSLAQKDSPIRVNPFLKLLVERSLGYYLQSATGPENPPEKQAHGLIMP